MSNWTNFVLPSVNAEDGDSAVVNKESDSALLSEAAYVYNLPVWHPGEDSGEYVGRLKTALSDKTGNNEGNELTVRQASDIASRFKLIRKSETALFTGEVFENERHELFLAIRGTQLTGPAMRGSVYDDGEIVAIGTPSDAVVRMAHFWNEDCKDLHNRHLTVTGHSLGASLSNAFARLYPDNVQQVITFNGAGVSDLRGALAKPPSWWQGLTDQTPDWTWGESKTLALYTDSWFKMVHLDVGALYRQVGHQSPLPYAEGHEWQLLQQHSLVPLTDMLALDKVAAELGIHNYTNEAYVNRIAIFTSESLFYVTDKLAKEVGLNNLPAIKDRTSFYQKLDAIEERAPAVRGRVFFLGGLSADELAHEAVATSQRGESVRTALAAGWDVALVEGPSKPDQAGFAYWRDKAEQMLAAQTLTGPTSRPESLDGTAIAAVRGGLGGEAFRYSDDELSRRVTTPVMDDIKHNGFPAQEVSDLHALLIQLATREGVSPDKLSKLTALEVLKLASTSEGTLFIDPATGTVHETASAVGREIRVSAEDARAVALGRIHEGTMPASAPAPAPAKNDGYAMEMPLPGH